MDVTLATWIVALAGLVLMGVLMIAQLIAVIRPRSTWTVTHIYGGDPGATDPKAYFAFNQGLAQADVFAWGPIQIAASVGLLLGARWGFLLALVASIPFWYTAIQIFIWDRDLGFRRPTAGYWLLWVVWPVFGLIQAVYCFARLL